MLQETASAIYSYTLQCDKYNPPLWFFQGNTSSIIDIMILHEALLKNQIQRIVALRFWTYRIGFKQITLNFQPRRRYRIDSSVCYRLNQWV